MRDSKANAPSGSMRAHAAARWPARLLTPVLALSLFFSFSTMPTAAATATGGSGGVGTRAVWGIFSEPRDGKDGQGVVDALEKKIGRHFSGQRVYVSMDASFPDPADTLVAKQGGVLYHNFNSWHVNDAGLKICYSWGAIAAGRYNKMLSTMAQQVRAFLVKYPKETIYMSFTHEPTSDNASHPKCGSAKQYIAAYDRVVQVFKNQHVTRPRVLWTWTNVASVYNGEQGGPLAWQPHTYDVVGVDGYNHSPGWRTPSQVFGKAEAFAKSHNKGILIGEIGIDEVGGDPMAKGEWVKAVSAMFHGWNNLAAIMWTNTNNGGDYWMDSSAKSLAAFQKAGKDFR
jgi:hypothetical protein